MSKTAGVIGASGWLGVHLSTALAARGWNVVGYSRSKKEDDKIEWRQWDGEGEIDLGGIDSVINLAGEAIDQRWNVERKKAFRKSRVDLTRNLVQAMEATGVKTLLNGSAVGFYGDRNDDFLPESEPHGSGYLAKLCVDWEEAASTDEDIRVCLLRTGVVLGNGGRAWDKIEGLFKWGIGGRLGSGEQFMPWIHLDDEIAAIIHCLENEISGPVNLVAPESERNRDFTKAVGRALNRPTIFPTPAFMLKLVLGDFAEEGLLSSMRVVPKVLEETGFSFAYPDLKSALSNLTR